MFSDEKNKWLIALATVGIHISIGSVYAWSVLVKPIMEECGFGLTATTFVFSLAIFFLGLSASTLGKYVDKYGAKVTGLVATMCFVLGLFGTAMAVSMKSIVLLYVFYGVFVGIGLGLGYVTPVSTLVKYFPNNPGVASGIAIMGFGFGAVVASPVMQWIVAEYNLASNFLLMGFSYMFIMVLSSLYFSPPKDLKKEEEKETAMKPKQVYKTWQFKMLFFLFFINITCGIGLLAVISPMLQDIFEFTPARAAAFVGIVGLINGVGRLLWASLSDVITRKWTYVVFFLLQAGLFMILGHTANEYLFEIFVLVIISCYGGGFSCMPAYLNDLFGKQYLSTIHGRILFAWGLAGLAGPVLIAIGKEQFGSFEPILYLFGGLFIINTFLAYYLKNHQEISEETEETVFGQPEYSKVYVKIK